MAELAKQFEFKAFSKDVLVYSAGNLIFLVFGFIVTFVLPKFLSMEDYGYWQLFIMYSTYTGITHLGFNDGLLLRWAGKSLPAIGGEVKKGIYFLFFQQIAILIPLSIFLFFILKPPLQIIALLLLLYSFIYNLLTYFMFAAQAARKFNLLSITVAGRIIIFLFLVAILIFTENKSFYFVVITYIVSFFIFLIVYIFVFKKYLNGQKLDFNEMLNYGKKGIAVGAFILLGNLMVNLFITVDRLMVSTLFTIEIFAIYAFSLSIIIVAYNFIKAISDVFFPYLARIITGQRIRTYQTGEFIIIVVWAIFLTCYFPLAWIINIFLPEYIESIPIMRILMCAVGISSLVQILHVNYYKINNKQRAYFINTLIALVLSILLILLFFNITRSLESIAIAIFIGFVIWYILNELNLKLFIRNNSIQFSRTIIIQIVYGASFFIVSLLPLHYLIQMIIFFFVFCFITVIFFRSNLQYVVSLIKDKKT